jgi:hypothetical protein
MQMLRKDEPRSLLIWFPEAVARFADTLRR